MARATGANPLRTAVHDRHSAGCRRLPARASWTSWICGAGRTARSCVGAVSRARGWAHDRRRRRRGRDCAVRGRARRARALESVGRGGREGRRAGRPGTAERRRVDARRRHDRAHRAVDGRATAADQALARERDDDRQRGRRPPARAESERTCSTAPTGGWPSRCRESTGRATWTRARHRQCRRRPGARGAIPFHLEIESPNLSLQPGVPQSWILRLSSRTP